jgi:cell division protein FtsL
VRENQGNVALVFPSRKSREWESINRSPRRVLKRGLPMAEKLLYLVSVILCVFLASIILTRYAKVMELNAMIRETETKLEKTREVNLQLESEKEKLKSVERIRQFAEENGLQQKSTKMIPSIRP